MTAHEMAKKLLDGPDHLVIGCEEYSSYGVREVTFRPERFKVDDGKRPTFSPEEYHSMSPKAVDDAGAKWLKSLKTQNVICIRF